MSFESGLTRFWQRLFGFSDPSQKGPFLRRLGRCIIGTDRVETRRHYAVKSEYVVEETEDTIILLNSLIYISYIASIGTASEFLHGLGKILQRAGRPAENLAVG